MFRLNRYWFFLVFLIIAYGLFEYYRPKPLNWVSTYSNKDNIPFGTEVMFSLLPDLVGGKEIKSLRMPPYNHLEGDSLSKTKSTYVFINRSFQVDDNDQKALLAYVKKGNCVFVSAYDFPDSIMNVLGVKALLHEPTKKDTAKYIHFTNPALRDKKGFIFPKDDGRNYFKILDFSKTVLLASNEKNEPVFVQVNYGKGQFYLHNLPLAFTNYFVVDKSTNRHAFKALSYLPEQPVFWDEYHKQGRFGDDEKSVFRYIMSQPALKMAYIITLACLLLFAIFTGKRRQRIIPVIDPPRNVSLDFVHTIGNMYYRKRDHANMAEKLIHHFWMYVRERFGVTGTYLNEDEIQDVLLRKSGMPEAEAAALQHDLSGPDGKWTADRLMDLNRRLEVFYEITR